MSEPNLRNQALNGTIWSFVERFSVQIVRFLLTIVIARLLTPDDYGLIGMLAIFISLSQVFIDGGLSSALVQKQDRTKEDYSTVFYANLIVSLVIYVLLFVSAPWIAEFYEQPLLTPITRVYTLDLILNSLIAVHRTILVIKVDFKTQSKISLISIVFSGLLGIWTAWIGWGVWALVIQLISQTLLNIILSVWYVRWWPSWTFSMKSFRQLFSFGSRLMVAKTIHNVYTSVYNLVIGKRFTSADLGYYTKATEFTTFAGGNISQILQRVTFPILSQIQDDDKRLLAIYQKYIKIISFVVFPLIMLMFGTAKPMIQILLTDKWLDCVILLQILSFKCMWDCVIQTNINLLYVKGRSDYAMKLEIVKKIIAFTILAITMFFNLVIICIGQVVYTFISVYMNCYYTKKILGYSFWDQIKDILPWLLLSFFIGFESLFITMLISMPWISFVGSLLTGGITYIAISALFKFEPYIETYNLVKEYAVKIKR